MKLFLKNSLSSTLLTMLIFLVRNYLQEMEQKKDPFPRQVSVFPGRNVSEQESSKGRCAKGPSRHVHIWSQHSAHSWHGKEVLGRRHGLHAAMAAGSVNKSSLVSVA